MPYTIEKDYNINYNDYEIPDDIVPYIIAEPKKMKFLRHIHCNEFFKLPIEVTNKSIAIGSKYAILAEQKGYDYFIYNDNNYVLIQKFL